MCMSEYKIHQGNNIDILKTLEDASVDSVVTDPPYGIEFLAKDWDSNTGAVETWQECLRVLKPGGYLLAFSAARTYHQLATNIESVGFEIRDQIMWLFASGFPKALDIGKAIQKRQGVEETQPAQTHLGEGRKKQDKYGNNNPKALGFTGVDVIPTSPEAKQWSGWKTALKPSHEPIVMARKPFKGSTMDNVMTHGVGALNIDATRIGLEEGAINPNTAVEYNEYSFGNAGEGNKQNNLTSKFNPNEKGRFPSNVIGEVDQVYQKYFYCPKVSRRERHVGFEQDDDLAHIPSTTGGMWDTDGSGTQYNRASIDKKPSMNKDPLAHIPTNSRGFHETSYDEDSKGASYHARKGKSQGNNHPTVKPVALMKYLIELVTPDNATVLDPFTGSGSTGMAAVELGHKFIGCELDANYVDIARKRIAGWMRQHTDVTPHEQDKFGELFDER